MSLSDIVDETAGEEIVKKITKKTKKVKTEFYLEQADSAEFKYSDKYFISDIKDELNRICTAENVKKVTITAIWNYLVEEGYTEEVNCEGISKRNRLNGVLMKV